MILSIEENGYAHLFAYIPAQLTLTRLTSGQWSDIDPALSPDGKRIAFASNRDGFWNLYTLDIPSGKITQLTNDHNYNAAPTWSPDLAWIAYETYQNGNLQIALLSLTNPGKQPVILTDDSSSNHSPAWAPNGREIAFVSNSSGDADIWLADLNKTGTDRFTDITQTPQAAESHPVWNSDGSQLAWASASTQNADNSGIYVWDSTQPNRPAKWVGDGDWAAWNAHGNEIVAGVTGANQQLITAYTTQGNPLLLPAPLPGTLRGIIWPDIALPNPLPQVYQQAAVQTPQALWTSAVSNVAGVPSQRLYVVPLTNVQAPYPQLQDLVDDSFNALRQRVITDAGWDALASLENAFVPLTTALDPGLGDDWLYTGRAFALNSLMINAGWMAVVREDIGSQTYWRLYVRAQKQDGSEGAPIQNPPWDLNARYDTRPDNVRGRRKICRRPRRLLDRLHLVGSGIWMGTSAGIAQLAQLLCGRVLHRIRIDRRIGLVFSDASTLSARRACHCDSSFSADANAFDHTHTEQYTRSQRIHRASPSHLRQPLHRVRRLTHQLRQTLELQPPPHRQAFHDE